MLRSRSAGHADGRSTTGWTWGRSTTRGRTHAARAVVFGAAILVACTIGVAFHTRAAFPAVMTGAVLTALVGVAFAGVAIRHHRLATRLERASTPHSIAETLVYIGTVAHGAVVAGLTRPRIYVNSQLLERLTSDEVRAVTLHERGHQRAFDPLRLAVLAAVTPVLRRSQRGRRLIAHLHAEREILADRYALRRGATRRAIASALLKMDTSEVAHDGAAAFEGVTALRMRALLGDDVPLPSITGAWLIAGLALGVLLCMSSIEPDPQVIALTQACCS